MYVVKIVWEIVLTALTGTLFLVDIYLARLCYQQLTELVTPFDIINCLLLGCGPVHSVESSFSET